MNAVVTRPASTEYAPHYAHYVDRVPEDDILATLERQAIETAKLLASIDEHKAVHRYEEGKWSVKELLGHVVDSERVFAYRALCFARGEEQPLPGFDQNPYVENASFDSWSIADLAEQYALTRRSTILLLRNLPEEAWMRQGIASDNAITVRALAWIVVGHERHHVAILRDRYGV
jgi:uncharacterized damage-inducible protein DinB